MRYGAMNLPMMSDVLDNSEMIVIGVVPESDDTTHVVYRMNTFISIADAPVTAVRVVSFRK